MSDSHDSDVSPSAGNTPPAAGPTPPSSPGQAPPVPPVPGSAPGAGVPRSGPQGVPGQPVNPYGVPPYPYGGGAMPQGGGAYLSGVPYQQPAPLAAASMWCGIVGLTGLVFGVTFLVSPVALVLGIVSKRKIREQPSGTYSGDGQATAGIVMGAIGTAMLVLFIVGLVVVIGALSEYGN